MPSITVFCPGFKNSDTQCEEEIELECGVDPGDSNYGADADGNRGMYVGPSLIEPNPPSSCSICHETYNEDQLADLKKQIAQEVADYRYEPPDPADY